MKIKSTRSNVTRIGSLHFIFHLVIYDRVLPEVGVEVSEERSFDLQSSSRHFSEGR